MPTSSLSPPWMPSVSAVISRGWSMALKRPEMEIFLVTGFSPMGTEFHMPPSKFICIPLPLSPGQVPARPILPVMTGRAAMAAAFNSPLWRRWGPKPWVMKQVSWSVMKCARYVIFSEGRPQMGAAHSGVLGILS